MQVILRFFFFYLVVVLFKIVTYTDLLCLSDYLHVCVYIVSLPRQTQYGTPTHRAEVLTEKLTVSHSAG